MKGKVEMKKEIAILSMLIVTMSFLPRIVFAESELVDGVTWHYVIRNNRATICGTSETDPAIPIGTEGSVITPMTLGGCPVVGLGGYSFSNCKSLKSIVISEGVESFGWEDFYSCGTLQSITFPKSLTHVGSGNIFYGTSAKEIYISDLQAWMDIDNDDYWSSLPNCDRAYLNGELITELIIPDGVQSIRGYCFSGFGSVKRVIVPASVSLLRGSAFSSSIEEFIFMGKCPAGIEPSNVLNCKSIRFPREYAADYLNKIPVSSFGGYVARSNTRVSVCNAKIRASDPTVLDVVYQVNSEKQTVRVRALAYKDGIRSFANVVRPVTFIDGTGANVGDEIAANQEHRLSWRVSADWKIDLAKVKFEVLAVEEDLLPLEIITIPSNGNNKAMEFSWNALSNAQVLDALLWLYADGDSGLMLENGVLKNGENILAYGTTISTISGRSRQNVNGNTQYYYFDIASSYIYSKMGFSVLEGDMLTYAKEATRLALEPSGVRQYAYRWMDAH